MYPNQLNISEVKVEDCKRNSSLLVSNCIHKLEKEFEKAGLSSYSFELRQKLETSLQETFREIEMNVSNSSQSQEARVAAAISSPPTPCSPFYVPSSPTYVYSSYSPGNISCSPFYTPSSPPFNPYFSYESFDCSPPLTATEETPTANLSSKSKRMNEGNSDRNTDSKKIKLDISDCPTVNEEVKQADLGEEIIEKEGDETVVSENPGVQVEEGAVNDDV